MDYKLLITGALLGILYSLKGYALALYSYFKDRIIRTTVIDRSETGIYWWLSLYFRDKYSHKFKDTEITSYSVEEEYPNEKLKVDREMRSGWFTIKVNGKRLIVSFTKTEGKDDPNIKNLKINITELFNTTSTEKLLADAMHYQLSLNSERTLDQWIFPSSTGSNRGSHYSSKPLKLNKIVGNNKRKLEWIVAEFLQSKSVYEDRGLAYRLGITLYGEPGCGKSALVAAIAYEFRILLIYVNLAYMTDHSMIELLMNYASDVNRRPLILYIEEIDTTFKGRENIAKAENEKGVTFSTFLNLLSGSIQFTNCIVIATTNNIDVLDPALKRAGRLGDHLIEFTKPTREEIEEFICMFYNIPNEQQEFVKLGDYKDNMYNFADIKNLCVMSSDYKQALSLIESSKELV